MGDYMRIRASKRLSHARFAGLSPDDWNSPDEGKRASALSTPQRLQIVEELLQRTDVDTDSRDELLCIKTVMGPSSQEDKLCFLLQDAKRFEWLSVWLPRDERACFQPFANSTAVFDAVSVSSFKSATNILLKSEKTIGAVSHGVARLILKEWKEPGLAQNDV